MKKSFSQAYILPVFFFIFQTLIINASYAELGNVNNTSKEKIVITDTMRKSVFEGFLKTAKEGNPKSQYYVAGMYINGEGVAQDYQKAFEWLSKAANQGHAVAQYNLGVMYENGYGTERNREKAKEWFKKAADQGYAP